MLYYREWSLKGVDSWDFWWDGLFVTVELVSAERAPGQQHEHCDCACPLARIRANRTASMMGTMFGIRSAINN